MRVRANADAPEDAAKAREFGAEDWAFAGTEHMFMAPDRLPVVQEMILAADEKARRAALDRLLPVQQGGLRGIRGDGGLPPSRSACSTRRSTSSCCRSRRRRRMRCDAGSSSSARQTPCSGRVAAVSVRSGLEIYEMQVRAIVRAARAVGDRTGEAPLVEIMPARRLRRGGR